MALLTAKGPISKPEEILADCLAAAPEFLLFTKEANATAARTHIYYNQIDRDSDTEIFVPATLIGQRPLVCLWTDPDNALTIRRAGTNRKIVCQGTINAYFEKEVQDALDAEPTIDATKDGEVFRFWTNMIGQLAIETFNDDIMNIDQLNSFEIWQMPPNDSNTGLGNYFGAYFKIQWGNE